MTQMRGPGPVSRIRIRRRGQDWSVTKQTRVDEMTLPGSSELPEGHGRPLAGFWFEVVDNSGNALYRRILHNPTEPSVEVPSAAGGFERVDIDRPEVEFDVLVPDLPEAAELCFFESEPRAGDTAATIERARQPVARLPLTPPKQQRQRGKRS